MCKKKVLGSRRRVRQERKKVGRAIEAILAHGEKQKHACGRFLVHEPREIRADAHARAHSVAQCEIKTDDTICPKSRLWGKERARVRGFPAGAVALHVVPGFRVFRIPHVLAVAVAVALGYEIARFFLFSGFHAWGDRVRERARALVCVYGGRE